MTTIGKFKKSDKNAFAGGIFTVELQSRDVHILPFETLAGANGPTHRVTVGEVEIGLAWADVTPAGRHSLRLELDEPSFAEPIYANLVKDLAGNGFTLILARDNKDKGG